MQLAQSECIEVEFHKNLVPLGNVFKINQTLLFLEVLHLLCSDFLDLHRFVQFSSFYVGFTEKYY